MLNRQYGKSIRDSQMDISSKSAATFRATLDPVARRSCQPLQNRALRRCLDELCPPSGPCSCLSQHPSKSILLHIPGLLCSPAAFGSAHPKYTTLVVLVWSNDTSQPKTNDPPESERFRLAHCYATRKCSSCPLCDLPGLHCLGRLIQHVSSCHLSYSSTWLLIGSSCSWLVVSLSLKPPADMPLAHKQQPHCALDCIEAIFPDRHASAPDWRMDRTLGEFGVFSRYSEDINDPNAVCCMASWMHDWNRLTRSLHPIMRCWRRLPTRLVLFILGQLERSKYSGFALSNLELLPSFAQALFAQGAVDSSDLTAVCTLISQLDQKRSSDQ